MKRLVLMGLLIASGSVFATDYYCPSTITCTNSNIASCIYSKDGSSNFNMFHKDLGVPVVAAIYHWTGAFIPSHDNQDAECVYYGYSQDKITSVLEIVQYSQMLLYADRKASTFWDGGSSEGVHCGSQGGSEYASPQICPFTDEYQP